ncbi:MAG: primosomal protein N' [Muribaculaceae bacterium]|nr:primosomal protein N' [Bacteroidales bacterium]MDY2733216.1 primosomal protein N' [Muribaculaceae bacterium]
MFAEIIVPLPLYGTYTYRIPPEIQGAVQVGSRVLVQFGKKKFYTGLVSSLHNETPTYEVKDIVSVLDPKPLVKYPQLKLWNWISEYYLCSVGEVYKAAVPTGLKPESETMISLNEEFGTPEGVKLTERQAMVVMLLEEKKRLRISDIEKELKIKNVTQIAGSMLDMGIIHIDEKIVERYHAKSETYIELNIERGDQEGLKEFFDKTHRSQYQEKALICWLDLSGWMQSNRPLLDVTRKQLLDLSGISAGILRSMIEKGIFRQEKRSINRFNGNDSVKRQDLATLSPQQQRACQEITEQLRSRQSVLLHGVTGSGKTEVYTHLIDHVLKTGNQVLYLVPEISLTTQLTDRLRKVFGDRLLVYHSKFSDSERVDIWKRLLESNEPMVVLGVRSSVFLPFGRLGLVIVDEEHESSYKQYDPAPRYNARDTAMVLASMHGAKVVLGSATPSIETYYKATTGKYGLVTLSERYEGAVLPEVEIIDMREQRKKKQNIGTLSSPLIQEMRGALSDNKQVILFQNRRGFAPVVVCQQCGWTPKCENCDVSQIYHKYNNMLKCHYCGYTRALPTVCPACGLNGIEVYGYGTERIAEEVGKNFPEARISRMDLDTTRNKDAYQDIIEDFAAHRTDILVGTQMVSKGLDFGEVRMAGVINADTLLNFPDFRSNERAYNMLEQVAGRAGRRKEKGKVLIQTTNPKENVFEYVKAHDYSSYYQSEIAERERYAYPPFTKIINIYLRNKDGNMVDRAAVIYAKKLREVFGTRVLGPEKPFVGRIALWYIQSIMLKIEAGASMSKVKQILRQIYEQAAAWSEFKSTQIYYDVDPV